MKSQRGEGGKKDWRGGGCCGLNYNRLVCTWSCVSSRRWEKNTILIILRVLKQVKAGCKVSVRCVFTCLLSSEGRYCIIIREAAASRGGIWSPAGVERKCVVVS